MPDAPSDIIVTQDISWKEVWLVPVCTMLSPSLTLAMLAISNFFRFALGYSYDDAPTIIVYGGILIVYNFFYYIYIPLSIASVLFVIALKAMKLTQWWSYTAGGILVGLGVVRIVFGEIEKDVLIQIFLTAPICGWIYWRVAMKPNLKNATVEIR